MAVRVIRDRWLSIAVTIVVAVLFIAGYFWSVHRTSLHGRFNRVAMGMTEAEVLAIMGTVEDSPLERWPPQVSQCAEVWRIQDGIFVRREYQGRAVHTEISLTGNSFAVWRTDDAVVIVEYNAGGRVCGKVRLTE